MFRKAGVFQVLILTTTILIVTISGQTQDDHGARCGPFFNWRACPSMNDESQCCTKWGFCSETSNRAQICGRADAGDYYWNPATLCTTDADCQFPNNPGPFICSQDIDTRGACALKGLQQELNGTNPYGSPKTTTAAAPVVGTPGPNGEMVEAVSNPTPAPTHDQSLTSSSLSSTQTSLVFTIAVIIATVILVIN